MTAFGKLKNLLRSFLGVSAVYVHTKKNLLRRFLALVFLCASLPAGAASVLFYLTARRSSAGTEVSSRISRGSSV